MAIPHDADRSVPVAQCCARRRRRGRKHRAAKPQARPGKAHMKHASALLWSIPVVLASVAQAAEIGPCNDLDRISFLVGQTRSYAEGKIRIAQVDTDGEPVCCSSHLLIL